MEKENLLKYVKNKYSQVGQDGLVEHIFSVLGVRAGHFVEFGACDGIYLSNCRKLYEEGWSGIFIEADKKLFQKLKQNYKDAKQIDCLNEKVAVKGPKTLEKILHRYNLEKTITYLSIDIDGLDLEVFCSIEKNLPLLICLEGGVGPHPYDPKMPFYMVDNIGQSLFVIDRIARSKGYRILAL